MPEWFVPVVSSVGAVASAVTVAVLTYKATRKGDTATAVLTERRDTIADRDSLIDTLQEDIKSLKDDMRSQKEETGKLRAEVKQVSEHNNALTTFIYKMLAIFRKHNLTEEIDPKDVPDGIHI